MATSTNTAPRRPARIVSPVRRRRAGAGVSRLGETLLCLAILGCVLLPVVWLLLLSVKPLGETYALPVQWWPQAPTFEAYRQVWFSEGVGAQWLRFLLNTSIVAVVVSVLTSGIGMYMGYVLARVAKRWVVGVLMLIIVVQLLEGPALVVPIYVLTHAIGLHDTLIGYMLALLVFMLPFGTLINYNYARTVPLELEEAGRIDGANRWQIFARIFVPLSRPGLITTGLMTFLLTWGEYPLSLILLESSSNHTVARGLYDLISGLNVYWNQMAAAAVIVSIPVLAVLILAQRYLVRGLMSGASKG
ncbi:carbohydrate ABC transporter permease [Jiangella asiatica]|uniref:Carbohydrate ABC transporter permease n=1 Tax=Jiangella asiatica TaxID=2530372 RepID=A0A4R5DL92_9ACTN|nr:carbohydrate ABC transporter permease [Jiangella asiatica]TDE14187.1 carbohydrate ABC transporter permease [Jiangella asiatica]